MTIVLNTNKPPRPGSVNRETLAADVAKALPPSNFADQKQLAPDGTSLGWFQGPVLMSNWAPHKVENDDLTLVGSKVQTFLDSVATTGIPGVLLPGTYRSDARLEVGSNTTLHLHGVTLRDYNPSLGSPTIETNAPMLSVFNKTNVVIEGGTLDGRKASFAGVTEYKYGVAIYGGKNITVRDMIAQDCKGDGLAIEAFTGSIAPQDVVVERFRSTRSHRNGGYLAAGVNVSIVDSIFEDADGTLPKCGFDVEPINTLKPIQNIRFVRCAFRGNANTGFNIYNHQTSTLQRNITLSQCDLTGNTIHGFASVHVNGITLNDCNISTNGQRGMSLGDGETHNVRVRGGAIHHNGQNGVTLSMRTGLPITDVVFDGVDIVQNGQSGAGYRGIYAQNVSGTLVGLTVTRCQIGDPDVTDSQATGIQTQTGASNVSIVHNRFGMNTAAASLGDDATTRIVESNRGYVTRKGGVASVNNGGTIAHGLVAAPSRYTATATAANRRVAITAASSTTLTISLTDGAGTAITAAENVAWSAEV